MQNQEQPSTAQLFRAPDGRLYVIPDSELEQFEITGEDLEATHELMERGTDDDGFQFGESEFESVGQVIIPPLWGPYHFHRHRNGGET